MFYTNYGTRTLMSPLDTLRHGDGRLMVKFIVENSAGAEADMLNYDTGSSVKGAEIYNSCVNSGNAYLPFGFFDLIIVGSVFY